MQAHNSVFLGQAGRILVFTLAGVILSLKVTGNADAAEETKKDETKTAESTPYSISELGLDYNVPESPAFTILNLNPKDITHTASPRDFAASVLNGLDKNGNFQSGLAIDLNIWGVWERNSDDDSNGPFSKSPLMLTADRIENGKIVRDEGYVDGDFSLSPLDLFRAEPAQVFNTTRWLRYFWYRTSFSFATTKGAEETDKSLRLSGGVHLTPWSLGDPRYQVAKCIVDKVEQTNEVLKDIDRIVRKLDDRSKVPNHTESLPELSEPLTQARALLAFETSDLHAEFKEARKIVQKKLRMECLCDEELCMPIDDSRAPAAGTACEASRDTPLEDVALPLLKKRIKETAKWVKAYEDSKGAIEAEERARAINSVLSQASPTDAAVTRSPEEEKKAKEMQVLGDVLAIVGDKIVSKENKDTKTRAAQKVADKIVDACRAENKDNSNYSAWNVAAAPAWISQDGTTADLRWNGWGIWTSLAIGPDFFERKGHETKPADRSTIGKSLQLILHGRYRFDERVPTDKKMAQAMAANSGANMDFYDNESWLAGGRLQALFTDYAGASFEGVAINDKVALPASMGDDRPRDDTYFRFAIVPTFRFTDDLWVDVSIGTDVSRHNQKNEGFLLSSIKYGYSQAPWGSRGNRQALKP